MSTETAYLGGGCFWGMEELVRKLPGVTATDVGYVGGDASAANYTLVKTGSTGHAETLKVEFDPQKLSYKQLLEFFFRIHDPTTLNQQGNDRGSQYRSVIFYASDEQEKTARQVKDQTEASGKWKKPIVTHIVKFDNFYKAEEYHQDYLVKNPGGYTCHWIRD